MAPFERTRVRVDPRRSLSSICERKEVRVPPRASAASSALDRRKRGSERCSAVLKRPNRLQEREESMRARSPTAQPWQA